MRGALVLCSCITWHSWKTSTEGDHKFPNCKRLEQLIANRPPPFVSHGLAFSRTRGRNANMGKMIAVLQRNTVCFNTPESSPKTQQAHAAWNAAQRKAHMCTAGKCDCNAGECSTCTSPIYIICQIMQDFQICVSVQRQNPVTTWALIQEDNDWFDF